MWCVTVGISKVKPILCPSNKEVIYIKTCPGQSHNDKIVREQRTSLSLTLWVQLWPTVTGLHCSVSPPSDPVLGIWPTIPLLHNVPWVQATSVPCHSGTMVLRHPACLQSQQWNPEIEFSSTCSLHMPTLQTLVPLLELLCLSGSA